MRSFHESVWLLLSLIGAWLWLGASGLALVFLWFVSRQAVRTLQRVQARNWPAYLDAESLTFVHLLPYRIVLRAGGLERIEVFKDELSPQDWARLRRACLHGLS